MKIIMVFGSDGPDPAKPLKDVANIGEDTRLACDTAIKRWLDSKDGSMFVVTAGVYRPKGFDQEISLGARMADYIYTQCRKTSSREARVVHEQADTFNTIGEARAFGTIVPKLIKLSRLRADGIVIVAKDWHMKRCKWLTKHFLRVNEVDLPVSEEAYVPCKWPWWIVRAERLKLWKDKLKARSC